MADGGSNLKNPSRRKPRLNPQHDAEKHIQCKTDKAGLREVFVSSYKGRGVFASVPFSKGDFVLEYKGKLLSLDNSATNTYNSTEATFLFDFQWKGKYFCIDASLEDQSLGRLVNDEHIIPNCKMRTIAVNGMPHLCLFAIRDIMAGEEVTYNYGDSDWPWRKQVHSCPVTTPSLDEDVDSSHQSLLPSECVEPSPYNGNTVHSCPVTTPSLDEDADSSHQSLLPSECVEPSPYNGNTVHSCPVTTPSLDEDVDSSHQSLLPSECVEPSPYNGNTVHSCPVTTPSLDEDVDSSHQSLLPSECVEPSPYNGNTVHSCPVTTPSLDEDVDSSHQSLLPSECVEPSPYNGNTVHSCPVTTPSLDEDVDSSHQSLLPSECVEPSPYNGNTVHSCPVTTPSLDEDVDSSHQSLLPSECLEPSPYNGNTSLKCSTLNSGKKQTQIERRRAFLLHQRALLDQQLEELDNVSATTIYCQILRNSKEDTSAESMDESSHTDYSDADYIPDSTGSGSDDSTFLSSENKLQTLRWLQLMPVDNSSVKESSSALSRNKDSSTEEDYTRRKYRPTGKKTIGQKRKRNSSLRHEKVSSSISPETADPSIQIMCTSNDEDHHVTGRRNYCLYCSKPTSKISRHLKTVHRNKPEVAKALYYPENSKERKVRLATLRNRGNFAHNTDVVRKGTGHLVVRYRTKKIRHAKDFIHCAYCQGLYSKKTLWKHMKGCHEKPRKDAPEAGRKRVRSLCALTTPVSVEISEGLREILTKMHYDEVSHAVQEDNCILQLGQYMFNKLKNKGNNEDYIRQKMREVGRLVLEAQKVTPLKRLEEFFIPKNFPHVIAAVKKTAGYNPETNAYQTPSLALKLGHSLKKISSIVESDAMMMGDNVMAEYAKRYRSIHDSRWEEFISSAALNTLKEAKWNMPQILPFAEDVKLLNFHMEKQQSVAERMLRISPTPENYAALAQVTLALAITFNRRRAGEVSRMLLTAFRSRDKSVLHDDVAICLTPFEKKMCEYFTRVEIRGKRGRMVPVLLKPSMVMAMELLVEMRELCHVPSDNVFMFGRPEASSAYRGGECLKKFTQLCGAQHPEALTSTKLRKHIATMSQVLNLEENDCDQLADFLGHDIRIHRQYYRLPQGTLQLARMSKVLLAMEGGTVSKYKGMTLEDIEIDPEETVTHSNEAPSSDTSEEECTNTEMENILPVTDTPASLARAPAATQPRPVRAERHRRKWTTEEAQAVEKHLMNFITTFTVPAKHDCMLCLQNESETLKDRTWTDVKHYVRNRITALKRQTSI